MKRLLTYILCVLLIVSLAAIAVGCKNDDGYKTVDNISYIQTALYTGQSLNFTVSVTKGRSEQLFIADGKVGELKEFNTLTVVPLNIDLLNNSYNYKLIGENGELEGSLAKDNFGASYNAELSDITTIGTLTSITIIAVSIEDEICLVNKLADMLDAMEALEIARDSLEEQIVSETVDNEMQREIYIKLINDAKNPTSPYYWYIAYIASPTDYWTVLIDPSNGEIVSKKI
ncbi:MAG: hypothetical protein EOM87_02030 [Clostridia bacterium]|nr:hypothetical protein [Clostridia bacterium]